MATPCFWIERSGAVRKFGQRCAVYNRAAPCPAGDGRERCFVRREVPAEATLTEAEALTPTACDACGGDLRDRVCMATKHEYVRRDTGETHWGTSEFGPGAMYDSGMKYPSSDGLCLAVILPDGHHWHVEAQASNCTMKDDYRQERHHCWVRHGDPRKGEPVTVDKNGATCAAGAGSIASGNYHGFLRGSVLT